MKWENEGFGILTLIGVALGKLHLRGFDGLDKFGKSCVGGTVKE
jgi:hypothetical protein